MVAVAVAPNRRAAGALQSLLYGVALQDPATFVSVPLILIGVALAAAVGPVRRAMGVDPAVTLRSD